MRLIYIIHYLNILLINISLLIRCEIDFKLQVDIVKLLMPLYSKYAL